MARKKASKQPPKGKKIVPATKKENKQFNAVFNERHKPPKKSK